MPVTLAPAASNAIRTAELPDRLAGLLAARAARHPAAPALHEGGRDIGYGELWQAVQETAGQLAGLGVRPGDRLLVVGENSLAQVCLVFAAGLCDAWFVCVNARLTAPEVDAIARHCGARRAFYTDGVSPEAAAHGARHGARHLPASALVGRWLAGPLDADAQPEPVHADGARQCAALLYTSGTTGRPKGVMLSHRSLLYVAAVSATLRRLAPQDRAAGVLPLSHVYGLASVLLGTLHAGACLHLVPRFTPAGLLRMLAHDGITILQGVPALYARLLEAAAGGPVASRLRFLYAGGSPLAPALKARVEAAFGLPLHNGYGMTETAPTISQTRVDVPRADASVGYPIPGIETRIDAALGELWVRGPNVMLGYYRDAAQTAAVLRPDGWLNTGDVVRQDAGGALFIVGRTKELIVRAGFNVYPLEVETLLNAHPRVVQSAVVGRPVADGDEQVIAFVEARSDGNCGDSATSGNDDALAGELSVYLAGQLAPYKLPARIVLLAALPAAASGKVLKGALRELALGLPAPASRAPAS
ncbi:MAG TPA: AMP-binding protein [Pseudoduganella sp.]|jgi:acyl-CoA synthetase (AMP-forming)/AMP-acid ligase II